MRLHATALALLAASLASACVMVPVRRTDYAAGCADVTHHMELQAVQLDAVNGCKAHRVVAYETCTLTVIAATGLVAVSAVVSGSIVVVGNVAYWAERRWLCGPDSAAAPSPA